MIDIATRLSRVMPVGAKQLKALLKEDEAAIVLLGRARAVKGNAPQPIKPLVDESGSFVSPAKLQSTIFAGS